MSLWPNSKFGVCMIAWGSYGTNVKLTKQQIWRLYDCLRQFRTDVQLDHNTIVKTGVRTIKQWLKRAASNKAVSPLSCSFCTWSSKPLGAARWWLHRKVIQLWKVCFHVYGNKWYLSCCSPQALFADRILPFDENAALIWAQLMADGRSRGRPRSALDMINASVANANGCVVVTANERDFLWIDVLNPLRNESKNEN